MNLQEALVLIELFVLGPQVLIYDFIGGAKFIDIGLALGRPWQFDMPIHPIGCNLQGLHVRVSSYACKSPLCT